MNSKMVEVYYKLVKAGSRTIDQVPEALRAEVQALIAADLTEQAAAVQPTE